MVNQKKKGKYIGMAGALVVHVAIIALLILVGFTPPEPSEEGGVPVMLGEVPDALGAADPSLVKVDVMPEETAPQVQETVEQDIITQETEETVAIKPKAEPKKKEEVKKPEKTEAEKAEEARKLAAAKAERERKEAEEAARKRVAGAFGKGAQMGSKGDTEGEGIQGSPTGNAPSGATSGTGGYGSFNLGGRSLGEGGLPRPVYNVQDDHHSEPCRTCDSNQHQPPDQYRQSRIAESGRGCCQESPFQCGKRLEQSDGNNNVLF